MPHCVYNARILLNFKKKGFKRESASIVYNLHLFTVAISAFLSHTKTNVTALKSQDATSQRNYTCKQAMYAAALTENIK